jgi:hypothetical protein
MKKGAPKQTPYHALLYVCLVLTYILYILLFIFYISVSSTPFFPTEREPDTRFSALVFFTNQFPPWP